MHSSLTLKRHNSFQNQNNRKAGHSFASRRQILKFQQEVLKFGDIFFKVRTFENVSFSQ